jgi:hypothetical protein
MFSWKSDRAGFRGAIAVPIAGVVFLAVAVAYAVPQARESVWQLLLEDDPAALAERRLTNVVTPAIVTREIADALAADDIDLANSFSELARDRGFSVEPELSEKIAAANTKAAVASRGVKKFAHGLISGEPDDAASLAGSAVSDLLVIGDIRDAARETAKLARGEEADEVVLGLACVGLAITAGTYASFGAGAPARASLTLVKAARKTGRISAAMGAVVTRALRETVDTPALRRAVMSVSLRDPAIAVRAARDAVKVEKAGVITRMIGDVGTIQARAGTRATLDGMKLAQGPRDLSRLARLAEKQGGKTRAILKLLGSAAIAAVMLTFEASSWLLATVVALVGFCGAVKSLAERVTWRYLRWRKRFRAETLTPASMPA